jgi:hypothetical protein
VKSSKILAGVLAALLALAGLAGTVRADGKSEEPKPEVKKEVKKGVLTHESLKEMLENLGYNPETIRSTAGNPMYKIRIERDGWTFIEYVSLSGDGTMIWISAPLKDVPEDLASAEPLRKLLLENDNIGPSHFSMKGKRLYMNLALENREVTPLKLRTSLDDVTSTIKATRNLWDSDTWARTDPTKKTEEKKPEEKK